MQNTRTIQFYADPEKNRAVHPLKDGGVTQYYDFSYYTLCKLADAINAVYPTPEMVAHAVQRGAKGILTIDELGNFISWE